MKKYIIFAWDDNSDGGPSNIRHQSDDLLQATLYGVNCAIQWQHVELYSKDENKVIVTIK